MKIRKLFFAVLLCAVPLVMRSHGQVTSNAAVGGMTQPRHSEQPHPPLTPQEILEMRWGFFFADLRMDEQIAQDNAKHGRQEFAAKWYGRIQADTGLTDEQINAVRQIGKEYLDGSEEMARKIGAASHQYRSQHPGAGKTPPPEIQAMIDERHKFCSDEVAKLVIALGSKSFATLDAYVSREFPGPPQANQQGVAK